jgi:uncharacterized membrane protein YhhN
MTAFERLGWKMSNRILLAIFTCFALGFMATLSVAPYPLDYLVKTIPILCLMVLALCTIAGVKGWLIGAGLLFSGAGDILLQVDGVRFFVHGLGAFLVAHLFYIAAFIRRPAVVRTRLAILVAIAAYGGIIGFMLLPRLGDMLVPVTVYLVIILGMGISASLGTTNHALVIAGACFFIVSDSLIAINRFLTPLPLAGYLVMGTYYAAQLLITIGSARHVDREHSDSAIGKKCQ